MYIIKISDDSYKVILSKEDLNKYGENVFEGGENSKRFFSEVLTRVAENGYREKNACIAHAEFFEDKFGGGELFLSLGKALEHHSRYVFSSKSIDNVIGVCEMLSKACRCVSSRLLANEGMYYLLIFTQKEIPHIGGILGEFGNYMKAEKLLIWLLEEHCRVLINSDAVEKLCGAFTQSHRN